MKYLELLELAHKSYEEYLKDERNRVPAELGRDWIDGLGDIYVAKYIAGYREGYKLGFRREIAVKLLRDGISVEDVAELTELEEAEVRGLLVE